MVRKLSVLLCLAPCSALAAASIPLSVGQSAQVDIAGNSQVNELVVNVPEGVSKLRLRAVASNPGTDIDLLARFGNPFPDRTYDGAEVTADYLSAHANFRSASSSADEVVVLSSAGGVPLRPGPLHISILNLATGATTVEFASEALEEDFFIPISVDFTDSTDGCDIAGWNDASARSPIRGNNGTTLGEQRRNAVNEAARLLSEEIRPLAPIIVRACWDSLEFGDNGGVLAQAGPRYIFVKGADPGLPNLGFMPEAFVAYFNTASSHLAGNEIFRFIGGSRAFWGPDIEATFNYEVDEASNSTRRFDYGFEPLAGATSFVSVAMHEISHGLGFAGFLNLDAADTNFGNQRPSYGYPFDDAYGRHARSSVGSLLSDVPLLRQSTSERLAALTSGTGLRFGGPISLASPENPFPGFAPPANYISLHAPSPVQPGSSYSHLNNLNNSAGAQLMTAAINPAGPRTLGAAKPILEDIGWFQAQRNPSPAESIFEGQYFDPKRSGHGFEIRRVEGFTAQNGDPLYFVTFYTYDEAGRPEFYTSTGTLIDGVFSPAPDAVTGDSLLRNIYLGRDSSPQTRADPAADFDGQVRIDFGNAANHPACFTDAEGRALDSPTAVLSFSINATDETQWCVQTLTDPAAEPAVDFSNQWYDPADGGWGLSIVSVPGAAGDALALEIYYPDAQGKGRWALVQTDSYVPGQPLPVFSFTGFCRECPPTELEALQIGEMVLDLRSPGEGQSTVSFDITWPGAEGGRFVRENAPIIPVGAPGF